MKTLGSLLAQALSGSWRPTPPAPTLAPGEWERAAPTLQGTGAGGLAWWRLRESPLRATPVARELRNAFRLHSIDARRQEGRLVRAVQLFGSAGIQPILAKGWAMARLYPCPGLRPYGDLDLHTSPEEHGNARSLLPTCQREGLQVDLHRGVPRLGRPWADVVARSVEVDLGTARVRVLGPEDHLALLCAHLLSHGAWRPLWLCDVALLLETLPADFDWAHLRALTARQVEEVRLVGLLAHRLLGAKLDRTPWGPEERVPGWVARATLRAWGRGGHYSLTTRIALTGPDPRRFFEAVRVRWPNPIEATVRWGAPYNAFPRLPYQVLDAVVRGARALVEAPGVLVKRGGASSDDDG